MCDTRRSEVGGEKRTLHCYLIWDLRSGEREKNSLSLSHMGLRFTLQYNIIENRYLHQLLLQFANIAQLHFGQLVGQLQMVTLKH